MVSIFSIFLLITKAPSFGSSAANRWKEERMSSISLKKSIWSSSTLSITAIFGKKSKKLLVYSQASVTNTSELPTLIFPPIAFKIPPTEMVGSFSASSKIWDSIDVVVVLPCVPEIAIGVS